MGFKNLARIFVRLTGRILIEIDISMSFALELIDLRIRKLYLILLITKMVDKDKIKQSDLICS